ncbi:MAG: DUF928 domain-containing protein [Cyanobacteria bacterium J06649_4]
MNNSNIAPNSTLYEKRSLEDSAQKLLPRIALHTVSTVAFSLSLIASSVAVAPSVAAKNAPAAKNTSTYPTQTTLAQADPLTAATTLSFRPPRNPRVRSRDQTTTTGTRADLCLTNPETSFAMLGPNAVVGRTASARPKFVWYLPPTEENFPVEFRLLAPNDAGIPVPIHTASFAYAPGYNVYQLPDDTPALVSGPEYRWQIVVECDPAYPSRAVTQELSIERVTVSAALSQQLESATNTVQSAIAYGDAGVWYEAIAAVAQAQSAEEQAVRTRFLYNLAAAEEDALADPDLNNLSNVEQLSIANWREAVLQIAEVTAGL